MCTLCYQCLCIVHSWLSLRYSLTFIYLVYPMLPVSMYCSFLIVLSVFSNVYLIAPQSFFSSDLFIFVCLFSRLLWHKLINDPIPSWIDRKKTNWVSDRIFFRFNYGVWVYTSILYSLGKTSEKSNYLLICNLRRLHFYLNDPYKDTFFVINSSKISQKMKLTFNMKIHTCFKT